MTDVTEKSSGSRDVELVFPGELRNQSVDDRNNERADSQLRDQSNIDTNSVSVGDQFKESHNDPVDASQSGEKDSPTKRFDEFTALIGETEASMRDKLLELTLPGSSDGDQVNTDSSVTVEPHAGSTGDKEKDESENTTREERSVGNVSSDATGIENTARDGLVYKREICKKYGTECPGVQDVQDITDDTSVGEPQINEDVSDIIPADMVDGSELAVAGSGSVDHKTVHDKEVEMTEPRHERSSEAVDKSVVPEISLSVEKNTSQTEVYSKTVAEGRGATNENDKDKLVTDSCVMKQQLVESDTETILKSDKHIDKTRMAGTESPEVGAKTAIEPVPTVMSNDDEIMDTAEDAELDATDKLVGSETKDVEGSYDSTVVSVCSTSADNQEVNAQELNKVAADNVDIRNKDNDVETECQKSEKEMGNNVEDSRGVNEGKETTELCNESDQVDNDVADSFMIVDVRSLTENSGMDNYSSTNDENAVQEDTAMETQDVHNKTQSDENQDTVAKALPEASTSDSVALEMSLSLSNSKSKRKSPNSVRRIADQTDLEEMVPDSQTPVTDSNTSFTFLKKDTASGNSSLTGSSTRSGTESLPVISNTFSMKDFSSSASAVKSEPPDDGEYGVMQSYRDVSQVNKPPASVSVPATALNLVPGNAVIHKGQIVSQVRLGSNSQKLGRPPSVHSQKLVISKVPPMVCPTGAAVSLVSSAPSSLVRFPLSTRVTQSAPRVQAVPRSRISSESTAAVVALRNLAPRQATSIPVQNGNGSTTLTSAIPTKDQGKDKTKETSLNNRKLSTINIHSVGVARITDLIARKNPIPTFKPDPIPENLKSIQSSKIYPCYECGDSFHFEKSLRQHLGRCSMKIFYKCEKCLTKIKFTNKCQLLNHLRSHLNIEKTQAVPIHIKSDSIEIETNYNDIHHVGKPFEWYKETDFSPSVSSKDSPLSALQCIECRKIFTDMPELQNHVKGDNSKHYFCDECPIYLNSKCALQAHMKLHELNDIKLNKSLSVEKWNLLKVLSCPECGKHFWTAIGEGNVSSLLNNMTLHLKNVCFHLSRLPAYKCSKCMKVFQSFEGMRNHLNTSLEHYYKCGLCPMALKSLKSLESHYNMKHKPADHSDSLIGLKDKIIYRCHVCDTLIDDKSFLVQHIDKHLEECKKRPETHYHCLQCGQIFMEKKGLVEHYKKHTTVRRQFWCTFCSRDKVRAVLYVAHMLKFHTSTRSYLASKSIVKFCDHCGLVCVGEHMFQKHACLGMRNAPVVIGDTSEKTELKDRRKSAGENEILVSGEGNKGTFEIAGNQVSSKCVACSTTFESLAHRQQHLRDHRDIHMIFVCKFCDMMNFKSYHDLRSHEIACTALSKMPKGNLSSEHLKKQGTGRYRKIRSKADVSVQKKMTQNDAVDKKPYTDGVELTPKESKKSSKSKQEVVFHMCDQCDAVFTRKSKQEEHIKSEHGIHPCHLCGLMHDSQSSLKKHLMVDHEGKRMLFYCGVCKGRKIDKAFSVREKLIKHFKVKHRMKAIDESKIITQLPGLPEPAKESTPESQKRKLSESVSPEMSVKKLRIEGEIDFKCAKCLFMCNVKSEFRQHILEHKAADTYQCFECGLCFAVLPSLKKHVFMVHKVRDFESYMEENKIEEPVALEDKDVDIIKEPEPEAQEAMEESSEEEQSGDPLECKVCYRSFESEKILKSHMRTHGMAFIRKSRKRAQTVSPGKKSGKDVSYSSSKEVGRREGLILKIKRLKPDIVNTRRVDSKLADKESVKIDVESMETQADVESEQMDTAEENIQTEPVKRTCEILKNPEKSLEKSTEKAHSECSEDNTVDYETPSESGNVL